MKLLIIVAVVIGLASSLETCCRYESVRCFDNQCDVPSVEELDDCPTECPNILGKCSTLELIGCAGVLAKCLPTCAPNPLGPECVKCMASLFHSCIKCVMP